MSHQPDAVDKSRKPLAEDDAAACCAAGICCESVKAIRALALILQRDASLTPALALHAATVIHKDFVLVPRGHGLEDLIEYVHEHPYE